MILKYRRDAIFCVFLLCLERSSGIFLRQLALPGNINEKRIQANCHNGVLKIILPKAKQDIGRKIEVKVE